MTDMMNYELTEDELMDVSGGFVITSAMVGYAACVGITSLGIYVGWKLAGCKK